MTIPNAILVGALTIALAVLGSTLVAPYRLSSSPTGVWRVNVITGAATLCSYSATLGDNHCS